MPRVAPHGSHLRMTGRGSFDSRFNTLPAATPPCPRPPFLLCMGLFSRK